MKRLYIYSIYLFSFCLINGLFACSENEYEGGDKGKGILSINLNVDTAVLTRSDKSVSTENLTLKVQPVDAEGQSKPDEPALEYSFGEIKSLDLELEVGCYKLTAIVGNDPQGKPTTTPFYEGKKSVELKAGDPTPVEISCYLTTVVIEVDYSGDFERRYSSFNYETVVSTKGGEEIIFGKEDSGLSGYFKPGPLSVVFRYGAEEDRTKWREEKMGDILDAEAQYYYLIQYEVESDGDEETGSTGIGITINNNLVEQEGTITIRLPKITQSLQEILFNDIDIDKVIIRAEASLDNDEDVPVLTFEYGLDIDGQVSSWTPISATLNTNTELWEAEIQNLFSYKNYQVRIKGDDTTMRKFKTKIKRDFIFEFDPWATFAFVSSPVVSDFAEEKFTFQYRKKSTEEEWSSADIYVENGTYKSKIIGLNPVSSYEYDYRLVSESGYVTVNNILSSPSFTTEETPQLPNNSFENWQAPNYNIIWNPSGHKDYWIYGSDEDKFWDSGNKGATTISSSSNLTTPSEDYTSHGTYSAKLASRFVGIGAAGRFAAGNLFAGEYKRTMGASSIVKAGGELDFGRNFTGRPSKLRGMYHYTAGTIDYIDSNIEIPQELIKDGAEKGKTDKAHIYVALSDKGTPYTIINTDAAGDELVFFDKNDPYIIAYGEFEKNSSSTSNNLEEFIIDLNYRSWDRIPTHIIIVCSSSKYGDYFSGSTSSVLYLDNFELIYDDEPIINISQ